MVVSGMMGLQKSIDNKSLAFEMNTVVHNNKLAWTEWAEQIPKKSSTEPFYIDSHANKVFRFTGKCVDKVPWWLYLVGALFSALLTWILLLESSLRPVHGDYEKP